MAIIVSAFKEFEKKVQTKSFGRMHHPTFELLDTLSIINLTVIHANAKYLISIPISCTNYQ